MAVWVPDESNLIVLGVVALLFVVVGCNVGREQWGLECGNWGQKVCRGPIG